MISKVERTYKTFLCYLVVIQYLSRNIIPADESFYYVVEKDETDALLQNTVMKKIKFLILIIVLFFAAVTLIMFPLFTNAMQSMFPVREPYLPDEINGVLLLFGFSMLGFILSLICIPMLWKKET